MLLASISKFLLSDDDKKIIIDALDWTDFNALLPLLYRHKIHHLFLKHIIDLEIADEIPYAIVNAISMQHSYLQFKHNEYMSEVCIVSEGLDRRQIPYVLLKGIGLSNTLFCHNKNIFRDYNDIDFLVEKSNVKKVDEILQGLGYIQGGVNSKQQIIKSDRKTNIYYSLNTHQEQAYVKFSKYSRYSPYNRIYLDINTTIFEGGKMLTPIPTTELMNHTQRRKDIWGNEFCVLEYTYEFLQLCYHFYKDTVYDIKKFYNENYCLIKFCDLREYILIHRNEIDWDEFITIVNQHKLGEKIYYPISLVSYFYGDIKMDDIIAMIETDQKIEFPNWDEMIL